MRLTRRAALGLLAAGSASAAFGAYGLARSGKAGMTRPLAIPPLIEGDVRDGVRTYDLPLGRHVTRFFDGVDTPTFGIGQSYLGPTLKLRAGTTVRLNVGNSIGQASTLHWHGMHLPAKFDGGPHQVVGDGSGWSPEFEVRQNAATLWYHSHMMHRTGYQVYHGLAGMIIVEDDHADGLGLPQDYGVDDVPLVLQDRRFGSDGTFRYLSSMHDLMMGMQGDTLLVNGTLDPYFVARTDSLRLRILNGSNARSYPLAFSDGRRFRMIASDGGLLESPLETDLVFLAPGERAEIIVDLSGGRNVTLQSATVSGGGMMGGGMMGRMTGGGLFDVLELRPDEGRRPAVELPDRLATLETPDPAGAVRTRRFTLDMGRMMGGVMGINGKPMDMNRIDEVVKIGTEEIWQIENPIMLPHPFHIHDVQFRVLDRNGKPPGAAERGLKDTVVVNGHERVRVLLRFSDYADPGAPYMYHCHILEHEDAGMMGQFTVTS